LRPRTFRTFVLKPVVLTATAVLAFAVAPVQAATPPESNHAWGDINSVIAGLGLTGGATEGDATLAVAFGGNGSASTVARSDHNHDGRYALLSHNHDDRYSLLGHNHDDRYLQLTGGTLSGDLTLAMGDLALLGLGARVVASQLVSTAPDGTSPFQVASSTVVPNLNADLLDGHDASDFASASTNFDGRYAPIDINFDDRYAPIGLNFDDRYAPIGINFDDRYLPLTGGTLTGNLQAPQVVATASNGTAPFQVGSGTLVDNLNADKLDGHDASEFALASQGGGGDYASLSGNNAFTGMNTFNGATTFADSLGLTTGGASFAWQPFYTSASAYSLRLLDTHIPATRLVIDQNGRIGIGTTTPLFPLHVVGDIRATNLNLGTALLGPALFDMSSASDRTFSVTNSGTGAGNLSVEGMISAAGFSVATGNGSARAGNDAIAAGSTTRAVSTTAVGSASLIFVTPDASRAGCSPVVDSLYVSARSAGSNFTVAVAGPAPAAGQTFCFNWWVVN
jgi:hypothetical protein